MTAVADYWHWVDGEVAQGCHMCGGAWAVRWDGPSDPGYTLRCTCGYRVTAATLREAWTDQLDDDGLEPDPTREGEHAAYELEKNK